MSVTPYLAPVDSEFAFDGSTSSDPNGDSIQYRWDFDNDGTWDTDWSSDPSATNAYTVPGVYEVVLAVTDDISAQSTDTIMAVVYDPNVGFATGGGWFWSGKGNLKKDFESEGKATFGFVVKYQQEAAAGNLEFHYRIGDINLKSSDMTWLVVSSTSAQFQGVGTINGEGLYTFRVLAKDGDQAGGQPDEFTIRLWEGTDTEADPIYQAIHARLGGGNIIVHTK